MQNAFSDTQRRLYNHYGFAAAHRACLVPLLYGSLPPSRSSLVFKVKFGKSYPQRKCICTGWIPARSPSSDCMSGLCSSRSSETDNGAARRWFGLRLHRWDDDCHAVCETWGHSALCEYGPLEWLGGDTARVRECRGRQAAAGPCALRARGQGRATAFRTP
jgi:hypothetical protein